MENYFDEYTKQNELPLVTREAIAEARMVVNDEREEPNFERTARHYYHYNRGIRYLQNDRYQDACDELLQSIGSSLEEYSTHDDIRFTRLGQSLIQYYRAENQRLHQEREFSEAVRRLEDAISIVNNFEYFESNPEEREYVRDRLQVYLHETEGNHHLYNRELDSAATEFGKAVGILRHLGRNSEADYFENRRRSIEAAKDEQLGDFESAANTHESIAEEVTDGESFAEFHRARAKICQAKEQITQREIQKARDTLEDIKIGWGITQDEIEYLNLILDELEKYESRHLSDIDDVLDTVADFSLETDDDLYVSYGHNYRPLVVNLLAAQRLTQFDIDESIPEILVDFSLDYILRPDQVQQFIEREGLSDLGLEDRWRESVPTFALKQYQDAERTESGKISSDNFMELGKMMTGILEQYLEFLVAYYGHLEYGSDWPTAVNESNDDLTLGSLVDYLNKPLFNKLSWADTVREVLTRVNYEDVVTSDKEGDIVDIRNDLAHNNIAHLHKSDYELIKEDLETIFAETSLEIPVLGEVKGKNEFGIYKIELSQINTNTSVQISTDIDLDTGSIYYFPPETTDTTPGDDIDSDKIVRCTANRVLQGVENHRH